MKMTRKRGSGRKRKPEEAEHGNKRRPLFPNLPKLTFLHQVSFFFFEREAQKLMAVPIARPLPSISSASARVAKALADIKGSQVEAQHNLDIAVRDLSLLEEQEKDLRIEVERVEGKREWVEGFRGWVEMLGGFLEEKVSHEIRTQMYQ
jgi:hypothetical protein